MDELQKKMLKDVIEKGVIYDESLSPDEKSAIEHLCRQNLASYSVRGGMHYFPNENGKSLWGDIREDSRRQKVQERVNRGNALRSWIAIIISLIALLSSFRSEIAWLWMQLTQ